MNREAIENRYRQNSDLHRSALIKLNNIIRWISNARLTCALASVILGYFWFTQGNIELLVLAILILFVFILLVIVHARYFSKHALINQLLKINEDELRAVNGDYSFFATGEQFSQRNHPFASDLDLFGEHSLFQFTNRTATHHGAATFAEMISRPLTNKDKLAARQHAIDDLAHRVEYRQFFLAHGRLSDESPNDLNELKEWLAHPTLFYRNKLFAVLIVALPAIVISVLLSVIFLDLPFSWFVLAAGLPWLLTGFYLKRINAFHQYISRKKQILNKYKSVLRLINAENFQSTNLQQLQASCQQAQQNIQKLVNLVAAFDARLNSMTNLVINALFLYDIHYVYRLEYWKEQHKHDFISWLEAVHELDALNSFANLRYNYPESVFPTISSEFKIKASRMVHPLMLHEKPVANDIIVGDSQTVLLITGANMAGKSTFLRTLGTNMVLALSGGPVFAEFFQCPVVQLRTGMRTNDSLAEHQSYFYAELNRLQAIMEEVRADVPMLILLDEILKGTNSTDKLAGSVALVKQLVQHTTFAIIATHDIALGEQAKEFPEKVANYCFEAEIKDDQLFFDYKLKPGLATKMNATFLMKKMGIIR